MATSQHTSETIPARVIAAYSDAELDKYLDDHRLANGGATIVDVEDPENLPESFIQRLRDRAQGTTTSTQPRPIDLDQVTARLLATTGSNTSPRPALPGRRLSSTPPPIPTEARGREAYDKLRHLFPPFTRGSSEETLPPVPDEVYEREAYNELVNDGGRPLYPIHLMDEVFRDPLPYWDMLRPWVDYPDIPPDPDPDPTVNRRVVRGTVFDNQWAHWLRFRQWQAYNRREGRPRSLEAWSGDPATDLAYECFVWYFRRGSANYTEGGSANYTEAAQKLLAEYDFVRPFQLHDDPKQQDALTTWIEYLAFACAVHYRYTRRVEKLQPGYEEAWKTLVDSKVLRPSEKVHDTESGLQRDREWAMASNGLKLAEATLAAAQKTVNDPQGSRLSPQARARALATAQTGLDRAKNSWELIKRRSDLIRDYYGAVRNYRIAKTDTVKSNIKLRWILEQVPLVEAEQKTPGAAQSGSHTGRGTKRKRNRDDQVTDVGTSKRLRKTSCDGVTKATPANESFTRRYTRMSATAPARASTFHHGSVRPKRAPEAPKNPCKSTRSSRRLAGQAPEFGLDGKPVEDAKPQVIPRSGKTRTGGVKRLAKQLRD